MLADVAQTGRRSSVPSQLIAFARLEIRRAIRNRRFVILSVAIPTVFYLLYTGVLRDTDTVQPIGDLPWNAYFMVSMASYGAIIASLLGAQAIATERQQGWTRTLRVTALRPSLYVITKLAVSWLLTIPAIALVTLAGLALNHVSIGPAQLVSTVAALALGALPFAAFGVLVGYTFEPATAQAIAMVSSLSLALLGGLWAPVSTFPDTLATIAKVLPSYRFADLGRTVAAGRLPDVADGLILATYAIAIGALVFWRYRSDEHGARG